MHCSFLAIVDRLIARALMAVEQVTTIVCFGFLPETQGGGGDHNEEGCVMVLMVRRKEAIVFASV